MYTILTHNCRLAEKCAKGITRSWAKTNAGLCTRYGDRFVRHVKTNQQRRRRLRLIKAIEERSAMQYRLAATALTIASDTETARLDAYSIRQQLMSEGRAKPSTVLRIEHPGADPMDVLMDRPYLMIGSDPSCDVRLDHDDVKPRHCYLQWIDGHVFCCDVGPRTSLFPTRESSNATWLDQQPFQLGPFRLSLRTGEWDSPPDIKPLDRSPQLATEFPLLALQFLGVEQSENVWPINRMLTVIGRGAHCKLRLNHKSMAHVQACLFRTSKGCWLIDLMKDGTTCINGRPIDASAVDVGDELQLGLFQVEVVSLAAPIALPVAEAPPVKSVETLRDLPPIRFDRQPKGFVKDPAVAAVDVPAETNEVDAHVEVVSLAAPIALPVAEAPPLKSIGSLRDLPPIRFDRQPKGFVKDPVVATVDVAAETNEVDVHVAVVSLAAPIALPVAEAPPLKSVGSLRDLPPIRFDRQPKGFVKDPVVAAVEVPVETNEVDAHSAIAEPVTATAVVERDSLPGEQYDPEEPEAVLGRQDALLMHPVADSSPNPAPATADVSSSSVASIEPVETKPANEKSSETEEAEPMRSDHPDPAQAADESMLVEFVKQQQQELAALKQQLDSLKKIYDEAMGQLISKRMRDSLEKPVMETMQCYDSMQANLDQLLQKVEK